MPKVRVGEIEMYYVEAGAGEPVVLIMGFSGDHTAWGLVFRALAAHHRVIAFDNRGAGRTDAPDAPYSIPMMAGDTFGLMDALSVESAHLIGVSMGGMIAQEMALARPLRVRSLHLGGTLARPDAYLLALNASWREMRLALGREAMLRALGPWLFARVTYEERPELVEAAVQNLVASLSPQPLVGFLRQSQAVAAHDTSERLVAIRCPTLVSVGEEDILTPPRFSRELAALIPGAMLRVLPRAGHGHFLERADLFAPLSLDFVAGRLGR